MMLHSPLSFNCFPPPSSHAFPSPLGAPCLAISSLSLVPLRARADFSSLRRSLLPFSYHAPGLIPAEALPREPS